jgi:N-acylneuraminate cytidylyltransferase/CMP-N,N'-diacetyllegionaminic acid synthase
VRKSILGVIPARGGSKGIPDKNIAPVAGKPLIAWTIDAATSCSWLDRVIVTTDDPQIASIAKDWSAEVPFLRPEALARDDTPGMVPLLHAAQWLADTEDYRPDYLLLLQPTSPLRSSEDIVAAIRLALENDAHAVVSVTLAHQHPYWMKTLDGEARLHDFAPPERRIGRRQDLPVVYALNGAIYLGRRSIVCELKTWYTERTYGYIMPPECSLDIDTPWDLYLADLILRDRARCESN